MSASNWPWSSPTWPLWHGMATLPVLFCEVRRELPVQPYLQQLALSPWIIWILREPCFKESFHQTLLVSYTVFGFLHRKCQGCNYLIFKFVVYLFVLYILSLDLLKFGTMYVFVVFVCLILCTCKVLNNECRTERCRSNRVSFLG